MRIGNGRGRGVPRKSKGVLRVVDLVVGSESQKR